MKNLVISFVRLCAGGPGGALRQENWLIDYKDRKLLPFVAVSKN